MARVSSGKTDRRIAPPHISVDREDLDLLRDAVMGYAVLLGLALFVFTMVAEQLIWMLRLSRRRRRQRERLVAAYVQITTGRK